MGGERTAGNRGRRAGLVGPQPTFAPAYQGLAHTFIDENRLFFTRDLDATIAAAAPLAHKAVALDVNDAGAHTAVGWVSLT